MDADRMKRDLAYYKGRLLDFEKLIKQEQDPLWTKVYCIAYAKCFVTISKIEARLNMKPCKETCIAYPTQR